MFVAIVTAPGSPAREMICASRSCCLALSTSWPTPRRWSIFESRSDVSTDAVPTSTGRPAVCSPLISSITASNFACSVRNTKSAWSSRTISRLVGITTTSSE